MKTKLRICCALVLIIVLLLSASRPAAAQSNSSMRISAAVFSSIDFVSNIETIGVAVSGTGLPSAAGLSYRRSGESTWNLGHPLLRVPDGRLIGSLFNLSPATPYEIKVTDGASEINGTTSTQTEEISFTPSVVLHVDDNALLGGDGSATAPFRTIQEAVNQAGPGTQVLVDDGIYREAVTFPRSGTVENWIQVKAAGNAAILDSADRLSGAVWTLYSGSHIWVTKVNGPVAYLARDGKRYYQYDDKTGLMQAIGHAGVTINEGWFYEPSTLRLYIRSLDNPASHIWQIPRLNHAFDLAARDWISIEGFEIRFYGTTTNGCGVCTLNTSHVAIRRNKIHNMQLGIFINWTGTNDQGNDTRIEQNEVYDPLVNEFPWNATKGSYMEGTGIIIRGHIGAIVRDNDVHNFFNGIYTGSSGALENPALAFDVDIYSNYIHDISDDALEPEGACINQRFRNNTIDKSFIGISLAPVTQGPTWVLRNTFTNFSGRGIKFADDSDGIVLIYQNTAWTNVSNINGADLITPVHNVKMRNNIFQSSGYSFAEVPTGSTANDWNHDNWYTTRASTGPHFKWENVNYNTISALCTTTGLECAGYESSPGFANPADGDFTLLSSSPNIDRGVVISGINDIFIGSAPDVGAYEFALDVPPVVLSSLRMDPNPSNTSTVNFKVTFSEPVVGVDLVAPFNDFKLTVGSDLANAITTGVTPISASIYWVSVNTGMGEGTIRLDIVDDNSIKDATDHLLGGANIGDGNFVSGEEYTITPNLDVVIGGQSQGNYHVAAGNDLRLNYANLDSGPVKVANMNDEPVVASLRDLWWNGSAYTSSIQLMGLPESQLSDTYVFPSYNNVDLNDQLRFGNVGSEATTVTVTIGGQVMGSYDLQPSERQKVNYVGVDNGPVVVQSANGVPIIASIRDAWIVNGTTSSFSQLMGLPQNQLSDTYLFPSYNNVSLSDQLRFGNVGDAPTTVTVTIGGQVMGSYDLQPNERQKVDYPGLDSGPVIVHSSNGVPIIASLREAWLNNGVTTSYFQMMGLPHSQLSDKYVFPAYDNVSLSGQLRFGNVSNVTTTVTITIGGQLMGSYDLAPNQRQKVSYNGLDDGPVVVQSSNDVPIIASLRDAWLVNGGTTSFSQLMGLPGGQMSSVYVFPSYNNVTYDNQLRIGVP